MKRTKEQAIADFKFYAEECVKKLDSDSFDSALYWPLCSCINHLINSAKEVMQVMFEYKRSDNEELEVARHLVERLECNNAVTAFGISLDKGREATFRGSIEEKEKLARDMIHRRHPLDEEFS